MPARSVERWLHVFASRKLRVNSCGEDGHALRAEVKWIVTARLAANKMRYLPDFVIRDSEAAPVIDLRRQ